MADDPICKQTTAASTGYTQFPGIDIAALDDLIHSGHQVFEVITRIVVLNNVAELLAIRGAAARVRIQHHISLCGHPLEFMIEDVAIGGMRSAVNIQDEWILFSRIKIRRLLYPGFH